MGGHLLHIWNLPEKRLNNEDFSRVSDCVVEAIKKELPECKVAPLRCFSEKDSHGDLDIEISAANVNFFDLILKLFGAEAHKNGPTYSFPLDGFQVDLSTCSEDSFDICLVYKDFERGMFLGRVANAIGVRFGWNGLFLRIDIADYYDAPPRIYDILVSKGPEEIFDLLGYDSNDTDKSFKNKEELFDWVVSGKYFSPEPFKLENLNHQNRIRNRKRPNYSSFIDWCSERAFPERQIPDKLVFQHKILTDWCLWGEIKKIKRNLDKATERAAKFNGNLIRESFGLEGAALGEFIINFKKSIKNFEKFVDENSKEEIMRELEIFYEH